MMVSPNVDEAVVDMAEKLPATDQQHDVFESEFPLTAQILPYAFAKRHGVLIGQIEKDEINLLHRESIPLSSQRSVASPVEKFL